MKWGFSILRTLFMVLLLLLLLLYVYIIVAECVQEGMNLMKVNNLCRQFIVRDAVSVHNFPCLFIYKASRTYIADTSVTVRSQM